MTSVVHNQGPSVWIWFASDVATSGRTDVIPAVDPVSGFLPIGRYAATMAEVHADFVAAPFFAGSTTRGDIWRHFQDLLRELRHRTPIVSVWLAGSFTTAKIDPGDLDVQFWLEGDAIPPQPDQLLDIVAQSEVRNLLKLPLDTYVGVWRPIPAPAFRNADDRAYYEYRGHWDDWWQRSRSGAPGAAPVRADTLPVRGYLEVMIDGFRF